MKGDDCISRQTAVEALGTDIIVATKDDLIDRAMAQTALMAKCERYTLARESHGFGYVAWSSDLIRVTDAMDALRELPSAQPEKCEDAVSREEAKWVVFCHRDHVEDQTNAIDELPSVRPSEQPERKTGHWIDEGLYADYHSQHVYRCSECGEHIIEDDTDDYRFCRWCGVRMINEEGEDE